jgi:REP element-mobilizing transposase RayT
MDSKRGRDQQPNLPVRRHLRRLDRIYPGIKAPLYVITTNAKGHGRMLSHPAAAQVVIDALHRAEPEHGWLVGRYAVMPSHVHFFTSPARDTAKSLSSFVGFWKRGIAIRLRASVLPTFAWQPEFYDHLLRREESYEQQWRYLWLNPINAGLVDDPSSWPYQGEVNVLRW